MSLIHAISIKDERRENEIMTPGAELPEIGRPKREGGALTQTRSDP